MKRIATFTALALALCCTDALAEHSQNSSCGVGDDGIRDETCKSYEPVYGAPAKELGKGSAGLVMALGGAAFGLAVLWRRREPTHGA